MACCWTYGILVVVPIICLPAVQHCTAKAARPEQLTGVNLGFAAEAPPD